ncbi:hypothetical protein [Paraferrimonas haliotis]|uniref:hypothetical protein n=1 Tax=Paraferrimonas haliotis TaxID=2013866 RepID=UPI000BA957DE|nr:hypothetical protein [Paraferrimonas haliotis]
MSIVNEYRQKFDGLSQRERGLIGLSVAVLIFAIGLSAIDTQTTKLFDEQKRIDSALNETALLEQQSQAFELRLNQNPNTPFENKLKSIEAKSQALEEQLQSEMIDMVEPQYMPELLASVLSKAKGVKLTALQTLPPTSILDATSLTASAESDEASEPAPGAALDLYSHGIKLTLVGDYFSLLKFLSEVEALPENLYWYGLNYRVLSHPKAEMEIEVYSVSLDKEFIRVAN